MAYIVYKDSSSYYVFAKRIGSASAINPNRIIENQPSYVISSIKEQVHLTSTLNVDLALSITSLDGINLSNGDRVLLTGQTRGKENGIYFWDAGQELFFRSQDFFQVKSGLLVVVEEGLLYKDTLWLLTTNNPITVNVTPLSFLLVSSGSLHAPTHLYGGIDAVDGDRLGIDYIPINYVRDASGPLVTDVHDLTSHLQGIDNSLATATEDLAATLLIGNLTGGTDLVVSSGDRITAPDTIDLTLSAEDLLLGDAGDVIVKGGDTAEAAKLGGDVRLIPGLAPSGTDGHVHVEGDLEVDGKLTVAGLIDPTGIILDEAAAPTTAVNKGALFVSDGTGGLTLNALYYRPASDGTPVHLDVFIPAGYAAFNRTTGIGYSTIQAALLAVKNYEEIFLGPGNHAEDLVTAPVAARNDVKVIGYNAERAYGTNVQSLTMVGAHRNWQFIGIRFQTNTPTKTAFSDTGSENIIFDHCSFRGDPGVPGVVPVVSLGGYTGVGDPPLFHNCYVADDSTVNSLEIRIDAVDPTALVQFDDCFGLPKMTLNGLTGASIWRCDLVELITHNSGICAVALSSVKEIVSTAADFGGGFPFLWVENTGIKDPATFITGIITKIGTCGYYVNGTTFNVEGSTLTGLDLGPFLGDTVRFGDLRGRLLKMNNSPTPSTAAGQGALFVSDGSGGLVLNGLYYRPGSDGTPVLVGIDQPAKIILALNEVVDGVTKQVGLGAFSFDPTQYTGSVIKFEVVLAVSNVAWTGTAKLFNVDDTEFVTSSTLSTSATTPTKLSATLTLGNGAGELKLSAKVYEVWVYNDGAVAGDQTRLGSAQIVAE